MLIFPAAQYALSSIMGYGFPSEVLISSGFAWIAAFLVIRNQTFSIWFFLSFLALAFSHELAVPAAVVIAYCGLSSLERLKAPNWKRTVIVVFLAVTAIAFVWARFSGEGATSNAIYVLDPRRLLNHPIAWLILAAALVLLVLWLKRPQAHIGVIARGVLISGLLCIPLALYLSPLQVNFELGRYGSARTMVGAALALFVILMFTRNSASQTEHKRPPEELSRFIPGLVVASLALATGANVAFILDHRIAAQAIEDYVSAPAPAGSPEIVHYQDFLAALPADEAGAVMRMNYVWTMRSRSVIVAPDYQPGRIINMPDPQQSFCENARNADTDKGVVGPQIAELMTELSCEGDQERRRD
ncbi:MAG: hypothetical protein RLN72_02380 [Henriciella sp.]